MKHKTSISLSDRFDILFNHLVPRSGRSGTLQGEVIRAASKIIYRWYNDGDKFYQGYGVETCGKPISFLLNCEELDIKGSEGQDINIRQNIKHLVNRVKLNQIKYETFINELMSEAFHFVTESNPESWHVVSECPYPPITHKSEVDMLEWPY